jgi:hypothetical protein
VAVVSDRSTCGALVPAAQRNSAAAPEVAFPAEHGDLES